MSCHVLDTTVLSNFSHVKRPRLVQLALGNAVFTTPIVMTELSNGINAGFVPQCDWRWLQVLLPDDETLVLMNTFQRVLDAGESESLSMAIQRGCLFLSDDFAARRLAKRRGVRVSGTLGILLRLVEINALTLLEANNLLLEMIANGYRSPVDSLPI